MSDSKRYVVRLPDGPHGGSRVVRDLFRSTDTARRNISGVTDSNGVDVDARVLVVDLDDLPEHGASLDAEYQHAEARAMYWTERLAVLHAKMRGGM